MEDEEKCIEPLRAIMADAVKEAQRVIAEGTDQDMSDAKKADLIGFFILGAAVGELRHAIGDKATGGTIHRIGKLWGSKVATRNREALGVREKEVAERLGPIAG